MFKKSRKKPDDRSGGRSGGSDLGSNRSLNRFGLNLTQTNSSGDNELKPLASPSYEEVPMWTVLPSYQLFIATFSKNLTPTDEDLRNMPPNYEPSSEYFPPTSGPANSAPPATWENSILANTHKLKRLSETNTKKVSGLQMKAVLTKGPGKPGIPPVLADPDFEYSQGDELEGFVTIRNTTDTDMSYDMFWVVFEGKTSVMQPTAKRPVVYYKFLNMFDYSASWSPVDDLEDAIDPVDGARLRLRDDRVFEPGVLYKKFFSFRIPDKILECSCEMHDLPRHTELLPTIGLARDQFLQSMRKLRERNVVKQKGSADFAFTSMSASQSQSSSKKPSAHPVETIKDLSFPDTAISYSVEARVVAKASEYNIASQNQNSCDEFIIVEECSSFFRVIPRERLNYEYGSKVLESESRVLYENLVNRITEKIKLGRDIVGKSDDMAENLKRSLSISKHKQLYVGGKPTEVNIGNAASSYSISSPIKKKQTLTSVPKPVGILTVSTPNDVHVVSYVSPLACKNSASSKISLPLQLAYTSLDPKQIKAPDIKTIAAEIVVFTYRSSKYAVPVELTPELVFKNTGSQNDNLENNVCKPFKQYLAELSELIKELNNEVLAVDSQLIMDIKSLADLDVKYHYIKVDEVSTGFEGPWVLDKHEPNTHKRNARVTVDFKKLLAKESASSFDDFQKSVLALVPTFQSCILGRLYFLNLIVRVHNENVSLKVPFLIER